jgi:dihydrofolate synthase/folylpolyglutamate synthase
MTFDEVVYYLENQVKSNDIQYLREAIKVLKLDIDPSKVIIVSGTNGKGTTCSTLQTLLIESGKNVGFFSSPHLENTTERIKFNGIDISESKFCNVFSIVHEKVKQLKLSHFEYLTFMAAYYFFEYHKGRTDYAIFEVGIGGTFDATNVIPHDISVITKIGFDHEDVLGQELTEIAKNKFGIISDNNTVFCDDFDSTVGELCNYYIKKYTAKFIKPYDYALRIDFSANAPVFYLVTKFGEFRMNLQGKRAAENTILAITVFDHLINNSKRYLSAIEKVNWPGRMEMESYRERDIYLSGDHNPMGVDSLLEILRYYRFENVHFIVGICKCKKYEIMLSKLINFRNSCLYITETPIKTLSINKYGEKYLKRSKFYSSVPIEALEAAVNNASENDLIIVTGSLYLVGHIKNIIHKRCL